MYSRNDYKLRRKNLPDALTYGKYYNGVDEIGKTKYLKKLH